MYIYGFGINHSHNAASNWYENKMNLRTPEVIHWFDEICGHYVIVGVYAVVQLYWICTGGEGKGMDRYDKERGAKATSSFNVVVTS